MKAAAIRRTFLDYFEGQGHKVVPSASLIPQGDPSLLFTSAGMVPFKPYFLGIKKDLSRAASCQKSFRTTDIERVGETVRHLTFFEMLGNFSFGDYFKEEAIAWAWDFLTRTMKLDPKVLHVSVFKDDDEAIALWRKHDVRNPIVKLGEDSNFWTMGPTGPCGPCSELYVDRGPEHGCGKASCAVGCDCDRYFEVWNLVFTQFDRQEDGSLKPLPRTNIDTGMGLERLAMVAEKKASPFETDLFWPVMEKAAGELDALPGRNKRIFRVLGDHSRAAAFLVAEGILPSNEGRGYVLRRLVRRALGQGSLLLKKKKPFVHKLAGEACAMLGGAYPELKKHRKEVEATVLGEENAFLATLEAGEARLAELVAQRPKLLPGAEAFKLYDTYGFPLDLTKERLAAEGIAVDEEGYEKAAERARETARSGTARKDQIAADRFKGFEGLPKTKFLGHKSLSLHAKVLGWHQDGMDVFLILDQTPFYPEGGGQVGDKGTLEAPGFKAEVLDTLYATPGIIAHKARLLEGGSKAVQELQAKAAPVSASVDEGLRLRSMCHHTGTHLLNEALRRVLGTGVRQAGSYVGSDRLRFDYTTSRAPSAKELAEVERLVNEAIHADHDVCKMERPSADVEALGAVHLVGESYGEKPRFVWIGSKCWDPKDPARFSLELCGGTHVDKTRQIELFKIVKETGVSAGVRRIEAVAGPAAAEHFDHLRDRVHHLARRLECSPEHLPDRVEALQVEERHYRQEAAALKQRLLSGGAPEPDARRSLERRADEVRQELARSPKSAGAAHRQVEAWTSQAARAYIEELEGFLAGAASRLQVPPEGLEEKLEALLRSRRALLEELAALSDKLLAGGAAPAPEEVRPLPGGGRLKARRLPGADQKSLRGLSDQLLKELGSGAVFLAAEDDGKLAFVLALTADAVERGGHAGKAAGALAAELGGKAGGRPDFAQGGCRTGDFKALVDRLAGLLAG